MECIQSCEVQWFFLVHIQIEQMLPFGGQGANQVIEDAGALGALLQNASAEDPPCCLNQFKQV